jgi:hypothetical protein
MTMEIATIAIAVGTFLAVIVALYREEITSTWRRPKVQARIKLSAPDCHLTRLMKFDPSSGTALVKSPCYYLRLWIENSGNVRADQVQVFVAKLEREQADNQFREDHDFLPMNLRWSHAGVGRPVIFTSINPGMGRHCDLGHIVDPAYESEFLPSKEFFPNKPEKGQTVVSLDLEFEPATYSHLIPPGVYRITLSIGGANFKPVTKSIKFVHKGIWYPEEEQMFRDGLGISILN